MKKVGIIILTWNALPLLKEYLPPLIKHTSNELADIIIADNGSRDDTIAYAKQLGLKIIKFDTNFGFAKGYNEAIKQVHYEYILLLNNDVRVTEGWLEPLYVFMESHPNVVSAQPKIRWDRDKQRYEYAGAEGGYLDYLGYPFCRGRLFDTLEVDSGQYGSHPKKVFWTTGATMMVRRQAYIDVGGFDERFFAHQEEIDLAWRWQALGYQLYVVPESIVYHYGGASLKTENPQKTYLNFRNNILMLHKNLPDNKRYIILFSRFFLDIFASLVFLLQMKPGEALAVIKGRVAALKMKKMVKSDGRDLAYTRLYKKSLLVRYHLFGAKRFSDLMYEM